MSIIQKRRELKEYNSLSDNEHHLWIPKYSNNCVIHIYFSDVLYLDFSIFLNQSISKSAYLLKNFEQNLMHFFQWDILVIKLKNRWKKYINMSRKSQLRITIFYTLHTMYLSIFVYVLRPFTIALYIPLNYCVAIVNSFWMYIVTYWKCNYIWL